MSLRRVLVLALVCLGSSAVAQKQSQQRNEDAAAQVFGPRWEQMSRDSGMIFSGTVLGIEAAGERDPQHVPIVKVTFHVDHAIAGVHAGREVTIREWAGAWTQHPMHTGQRVLLLLYPQSRLGLTSPVGGALGQVELSGKNTVVPPAFVSGTENSLQLRHPPERKSRARISLAQLERAIRSARSSQSARRHSGLTAQEE